MSNPDAERNRWFAEEVQPHEAAFRAYLRARFPTVSDQDDLVQESYVRLLRAHAARKVRNAKAYLFAMGRNAACDLFRRTRAVPVGGLAEIERMSVLTAGTNAAADETEFELQMLREAIESLPGRCRQIVTLRKIEGKSYREIAESLGISENTVNAQLAIGAVKIADFLRAKGILRGRTHVR